MPKVDIYDIIYSKGLVWCVQYTNKLYKSHFSVVHIILTSFIMISQKSLDNSDNHKNNIVRIENKLDDS